MIHNPTCLKLPSSLSSLETLDSTLTRFMDAVKLDPDASASVMVSTIEAVTNAIRHGNKFSPFKAVLVELRVQPTRIRITVSDEGPGFCPENVSDPTDPELLEVEGGRGVFLIHQLADEVHYQNDGRCVEMQFMCKCSINGSEMVEF